MFDGPFETPEGNYWYDKENRCSVWDDPWYDLMYNLKLGQLLIQCKFQILYVYTHRGVIIHAYALCIE